VVSALRVVENRPSPLLWPLAYTTACTTVQAVTTDTDFEWLSKIFNDTKRRAVFLRQLGFLFHMYNRTGGHIYYGYSSGSGAIWLDNVECIGYERSIAECQHNGWGVHDCVHSQDVSIRCGNNGKCDTAAAINAISC